MNKNEFLQNLKERLKDFDEVEVNNIVEYYDELISDAIEAGKNEQEFIVTLGDIDSIIKKFNIEKKVKIANEKPTAKNKMVALWAILGVTSPIWFPIALALVITVFVLIFAGIIVLFSIGITIISLIIALLASFSLFAYTPFAFAVVLAIIGVITFLVGVVIILSNFLFNTVIVGMINFLKKRVFKKGEIKNV